MLKHLFTVISCLLLLGGCQPSRDVRVSMAAQTNGTLGIPVSGECQTESPSPSTGAIRFIVVVTNEGESPIYFYSPHYSQGADVLTFEVKDNLSSRYVNRQGAWIRNLPNQIFVLQPKESTFFPIVLPSREWEGLSCTPVDHVRAVFAYSTDESMDARHLSTSQWYRAKSLLFGLPLSSCSRADDALDACVPEVLFEEDNGGGR